MNKKSLFGIMFGLLLIKILPLVSALDIQYFFETGMGNLIEGVKGFSTPFFSAIIGETSGEFFFAKILILLLLFTVITFSLKRIETFRNQSGVAFVIAAVISILAVRFISENQLTTGILLPYAATGIVIGTVMPIFVIFLLGHWGGFGGAGRRLLWIFTLVVMLVFGIAQRAEIPETLATIYWIMFAVVIFLLIFDKNIHYYFKTWELNAFYRGANQKTIAALQAEYLNIINVDTPPARARRHTIEVQLHSLGAQLP